MFPLFWMIDQKLAIITIHDVNSSHSEKILKTLDELNKLKANYNLSIVPYFNRVSYMVRTNTYRSAQFFSLFFECFFVVSYFTSPSF
jgi:hypothetical protein